MLTTALLIVLSVQTLLQIRQNRRLAELLVDFKAKLNETRTEVSNLKNKIKKMDL